MTAPPAPDLSESALSARVQELVQLRAPTVAAGLIDATLGALAAALPAELAAWLDAPAGAPSVPPAPTPERLAPRRFYESVAAAADLAYPVALDLVPAVMQALGEALGRPRVDAIAPWLGGELAALLRSERQPPAPAPPPAGHHAPPPRPARPTLADGRPGSARPLAGAGLADAHPRSVAATDDPRARRKLSSGRP